MNARGPSQASDTLNEFVRLGKKSNQDWGQPQLLRRRLPLQASSEFEGHISYQAEQPPSQVGMCGLGEPAGAVLRAEARV